MVQTTDQVSTPYNGLSPEIDMLCPRCHGRHVVDTPEGARPCPECGGLGEVHCCDGLQVPFGAHDAECPAPLPTALPVYG
jgi:RecJ-like exonuclease